MLIIIANIIVRLIEKSQDDADFISDCITEFVLEIIEVSMQFIIIGMNIVMFVSFKILIREKKELEPIL